jgi:hypothetical protein
MAFVTTFTTHVKDWKAFESLHSEILIDCARKMGATRYQIFRNATDAAEAMGIFELTTYEDAQEMAQIVSAQLLPLVARDIRIADIWEPMGWEEII